MSAAAPLTRTPNHCRIMRVITRRNLEAALAVIETLLGLRSRIARPQGRPRPHPDRVGSDRRGEEPIPGNPERDPRHLVTLINFFGSCSIKRVTRRRHARPRPRRSRFTRPIQSSYALRRPLGLTDEKFDVAREHYEAALRIDPGHLDAASRAGNCFLGTRRRTLCAGPPRYTFSSKTGPWRCFPIWNGGAGAVAGADVADRGNLPLRGDPIDNRVC